MIYSLGWWLLVLLTFTIGAWSIRLYFRDKDKRKLMFSIIFFLSIVIFIFNALNIRILFPNNLIIKNLYQWFTLPVMTAIFISVVESFFSSKDFEREFKLFIGLLIVSFSLIFLPFEIDAFFQYIRISIAFGVIGFSFFQLIKWKNIQSGFFLVSMISFAIAGIGLSSNLIELSIFAYAVAYIFLGFVFALYSSDKIMNKTGIGSYFSLQKKLDYTQSELEQSKELYKSIVENTQDVIILTNSNGINSFVSPSCNRVLGYSTEELTNTDKWPLKIHPEDERKVQDAMMKGYAGYPGSDLQYRIFTKNGNLRWISHSWTPVITNGTLDTIVSSIKDITDLKTTQEKLAARVETLHKNELATLNIMQDFKDSIASLKEARKQIDLKNVELQNSQRKLQKLNDELEMRVQQRTKEVEHLLKQKDAFIDQLGHDLKHPLGPFINLIPILKKTETDEKKREILSVLERNVDYMKRLVIRTVKLAKLNAPSTTFDFQTFTFADFVKDIIEKNKSSFERFDVNVITRINPNITVNGDPLQIEEVIENIFSNALKYGAEHGNLIINAETDNDKKQVLVSIKDSGQGMTPEQLDEIFNEFYKADVSRHDFSSTGLGLSISKRIIEKHNGRIWAESEGIGKGTIFYFTLPLVHSDDDLDNIYIGLSDNN